MKRVLSLVLALSGALVLLFPGTAWALKTYGLPSLLTDCTVTLEDGRELTGRFRGAVFVHSFDAHGDDLVANITLTGACDVGHRTYSLDTQTTSEVTITRATCERLALRLSSATERGITVDLSPGEMEQSGARRDRGLLCRIARTWPHVSTEHLADWLNTFITR